MTLDFFDLFTAPEDGDASGTSTTSDGRDDEDLATLVRLVASGRLHPELGRSRTGPGRTPYSMTCVTVASAATPY